jgi:hypothetical protein
MKPILTFPSRLRTTVFAALGFVLSAGLAQAHPGHNVLDHGIRHAVLSPYHLLMLAITGGTLLGLSFLIRRTLPRFSLQLAGASMVLAALAAWSAA